MSEDILLNYIKSRTKHKHGEENRQVTKYVVAFFTYEISVAVDLDINAKNKKALKILNENKKID